MPSLHDLKGAIDFAKNAFDNIAPLLEMGKQVQEIVSLIQMTTERLDAMSNQNRGPTQEEWDAQREMIRKLQDDLHSDEH